MLGCIEFKGGRDKISLNQERVLKALQVPRKDLNEIIDGYDYEKSKIIPFKSTDTFFKKEKNFKQNSNTIYIWGDESVDELIDLVIITDDIKKSSKILLLVFNCLNVLFRNKTSEVFNMIRLNHKEVYNYFKKYYLSELSQVVNHDIYLELKNEGLVGDNKIQMLLNKFKFNLNLIFKK